MDSIEQASALINATRAEKSNTTKPTQTTTISGKATSDSAGGKVMVNLGGDSVTYGGVQDIEVNASINVKKGDSVRITLVGADGTAKDPMVTDVVGGGDRQQAEINKTKNYFFHDDDGAHVTTVPGSYATGNNILIDSDSLDIRNGTTVLASYTAARVDLGKNSRDATISFCDGYAAIAFDNNGILQIKPDGDKCVMDFNQSVLELQSGAPTGIVPSSMELGCNRYGESWCSWSATKLYFVWAAASKTVNITMKQLQGIVSPCFVIRYLVSDTYSLATGTGNTIPTSVLNSIDKSGCFTNYTNYTRIKLSGYYELSATVRYNGVPQGTQVSVSLWDEANQKRYCEYAITQPTTNGILIFGTTPQIFHLDAGCNLYFSARAGVDCTISGYVVANSQYYSKMTVKLINLD